MSVEALSLLREQLDVLGAAGSTAGLIDQIRGLEELLAVAAAKQAALTVLFDEARRAQEAEAGIPPEKQGRGVAAEIGLARRSSPANARRFLGWAKVLTTELPVTYAHLVAGRTTVWRTMLIARETGCLSRAHRAQIDVELGPRLEGFGDRQTETETRRAAYRLDPQAAVARAAAATKDRRVSLRPAPDTMAYLTALLPVEQGVAAYAALCRTADSTTATGDERGRGQIMADTLVQRLTGQATADDTAVHVHLVAGQDTLRPGGTEPATVIGYGSIPAGIARRLSGRPGSRIGRADLSKQLESTGRTFTPAQRRQITLRDHTCRAPWCDAPIRHIDHITAHTHRGPTHTNNGQGLCEACNYAKHTGFHADTHPDGSIDITTPTGHHHTSHPPDPPRNHPRLYTRTPPHPVRYTWSGHASHSPTAQGG